METPNYQSKSKALLDYLTSRGYSENYVSQFRLECERAAERLPLYKSFDEYIVDYPSNFGLEMRKFRLTVIRLIRGYFEDGHLPSCSISSSQGSSLRTSPRKPCGHTSTTLTLTASSAALAARLLSAGSSAGRAASPAAAAMGVCCPWSLR